MYWKVKTQPTMGNCQSEQCMLKKPSRQESMAREYIQAAQVLLDDYYEHRFGASLDELEMRYFKRLREYIKQIKMFMAQNMIHTDDLQNAITVIKDVESEIVLAGGEFDGETRHRMGFADPVVFMDRINKVSGVTIKKPKKTTTRKKK